MNGPRYFFGLSAPHPIRTISDYCCPRGYCCEYGHTTMEISLQTGIGGSWTETGYCATCDHVPGRKLPLSDQEQAQAEATGRLVKRVPPGKAYVADTCFGRVGVTEVDDKCRFIVYSKLEDRSLCREVTLRIGSLLARNILVIEGQNVHRGRPDRLLESDWLILCRQMEGTFFQQDRRTLINNTFACESIVPRKMAEAGFRFIGSATDDRVACFACASEVSHWQAGDDPVSRYLAHSGCDASAVDVFKQRYPDTLPSLRGKSGQDRADHHYTIQMPQAPPQGSAGAVFCNRAILVTPVNYQLLTLWPLQVRQIIDEIDAENLRQAIETQTTTKLEFNDALVNLIKKLIHLTYFKELMSEFDTNSRQFRYWAGGIVRDVCANQAIRSELRDIDDTLQDFTATNVAPCIDVLCQQRIVHICQLSAAKNSSHADQLAQEQQKLDALNEKITSQLPGRFYITEAANTLMESRILENILCGDNSVQKFSDSKTVWRQQYELKVDALRVCAIQLNRNLVELSTKLHDLLLI